MRARAANDFEWYLNSTVLDAFPAGVVICDASGVIVNVNSELARLFGYRSPELIGKPVELLIPEALRHSHSTHIRNFIGNAEKRNMGAGRNLFGLRKDGTQFPLEIGLNPIDSSAGLHIVATVADISQRIQNETNFRAIVEAAPVGMIIIDDQGKIEHCNTQLCNTFGYERDELINKPIEMLIPERYRTGHFTYRNDFLAKPTTRAMGLERDLTGLHRSGSEFPVEIGLNPVHRGSQVTVIAAISDITERKKAELKIKQINSDLDEFTYVASHDLRSPLRGIASLVEWIAEDLGENQDENVSNNLERVKIRIGRMEKLIDDLLSYARAGRQMGSVAKIQLKEQIDEVLQLLDIPKGFKVEVSGYIGEIQSAPTPLQTVLRNLVSNAIKHHDRGQGTIHIHVTENGSSCIFDIEDDGPGIPTAAHKRVFKLFQTLSAEDGTRSGVGLAVCKRLVEAHGGSIELHSNEGQRGTRFRFSWPRFTRRDLNE